MNCIFPAQRRHVCALAVVLVESATTFFTFGWVSSTCHFFCSQRHCQQRTYLQRFYSTQFGSFANQLLWNRCFRQFPTSILPVYAFTLDGFHKLYNFVCEQFGAAIAYTIQVASSTIRDDCCMEYVYIYTISASCSIEHMSKCTQPVHPVASSACKRHSYPTPGPPANPPPHQMKV